MSELALPTGQATAPNRPGFALVAQGTFADATLKLKVRNNKYSLKIEGNWEDIRTNLFDKFEPKRLLKIGGSVAVVCYALYKHGYKAYDFAPGSLAFKIDVDEDSEEMMMNKIKSGEFQVIIRNACMETIQEFGITHLKDFEFAISFAGDKNKRPADKTYNFDNSKFSGQARAGIDSYHLNTVEHGAEVTPELLGRGGSTTSSQTKEFNFRGATFTGGAVAGVDVMTETTFRGKQEPKKQ